MAGSRTTGNLSASVFDLPKLPASSRKGGLSQLIKLQRKLAFVTVPAVLALGVVSYGSVVAMAAPVHKAAVVKTAATPAEPVESSTDAVEANEPALPGGGFADADNVQANTQQEGIN
jgi:hypothetical protein